MTHTMQNIMMETIAREGPITFCRFMQLALYHPQGGYYFQPRQLIGREGDFYTSVHVDAVFGQTLAVQLAEMAGLLGPGPVSLVEYGAGRGYLAVDILACLSREYPQIFSRLQYTIIEISPALRREQQLLLASQGFSGDRVRWADHLGQLDRPLVGCIFSNELVDAFPVHLVEQSGGALREVYVRAEAGDFQEELGPLSTPALAEYFRRLGVQLREGQRAEVNLAAADWIGEAGRCLDRGFVLTIDYGYESTLLYHPARDRGTLLCYHQHQTVEDPYQEVGLQDITAHVNFSALQLWGGEAGLTTTGFTSQMRFLFGLGIAGRIGGDRQKAAAVQQLCSPEGMGGIFKVLIQHKGLDKPLLKGLSG